MYLLETNKIINPPNMNTGDATILGKTLGVGISRDWPLEAIIVRMFFSVTTALTLFPATAQSPDNYDNILTLGKQFVLSVNDGTSQGNINKVNCSGVRLLEYNEKTGLPLSAPTRYLLQQSQGTTLAIGQYELEYVIPLAETRIAEPLHSRLLLPVHRFTQDPTLTITFQTLANIASAGVIGQVNVEVELIQRMVTPQSEAILLAGATGAAAPWGYIASDLIEQGFGVANVNASQDFALALGAEYVNLLFSQYRGGTNLTRNVIDASGIGDSFGADGLCNETQWGLRTGQVYDRTWRWRQLRDRNQWGQFLNNITQSSSPNFGGPVISTTNFQAASSTLIDFLSNGLPGDTGTELGSLLNCNLTGSLTKLVSGAAVNLAGAANASYLAIMGRRLFGDLSKYQAIS